MIIIQFIIIQTIIFGAVIYFLRKIMVGSTESAVTRLNESYEETTKKKEELAGLIQSAEEEYQMKKREAEEVVTKMKEDAEEEMTKKRDEMLKKTRAEAEKIIADTMQAKDDIISEIRKEEQVKILNYCSDLLGAVYKDIVKEKMDDIIIMDFLEDLERMDESSMLSDSTEFEIVSSRELSDSMKNSINGVLDKKTKNEINVKNVVDEKLISGIVVKFGTIVLDGSVAGKIQEANTIFQEKIDKEV